MQCLVLISFNSVSPILYINNSYNSMFSICFLTDIVATSKMSNNKIVSKKKCAFYIEILKVACVVNLKLAFMD